MHYRGRNALSMEMWTYSTGNLLAANATLLIYRIACQFFPVFYLQVYGTDSLVSFVKQMK